MSPDLQFRFEDEMVADLVGHLYKNMIRPASQEAGPPIVNLHWPRWTQVIFILTVQFAINGNT